MEVSSHNQQLMFAQSCWNSFVAVCVRVECHLHTYAIKLSAIDEENGCQQNDRYKLKFAERRVYVWQARSTCREKFLKLEIVEN